MSPRKLWRREGDAKDAPKNDFDIQGLPIKEGHVRMYPGLQGNEAQGALRPGRPLDCCPCLDSPPPVSSEPKLDFSIRQGRSCICHSGRFRSPSPHAQWLSPTALPKVPAPLFLSRLSSRQSRRLRLQIGASDW